MAIATVFSLVSPAAGFASPAALRAQASATLTASSVATCVEAGGLALYRYAPASVAADSGADPTVRKPNDISAANPGRWIVRDWPDTSLSFGVHGELLLPVVLPAAGPAAIEVANGWALAAVTDVGGVRTAWLRREVLMG